MDSKDKNSTTSLLESINQNGGPKNGQEKNAKENKTDSVQIGAMVETFQQRGFGPLLFLPALLTILPTGAIPGVPAICGLLAAFISFQVVIGLHHPWLPRRLKRFSIPQSKLEQAIKKTKPYTKKLDRYIHHRLDLFINSASKRIIAAICFVLSIDTIAIGFVPMVPALLMLPVAFFSIGYAGRDGLFVIIGLICALLAAFALPLIITGR